MFIKSVLHHHRSTHKMPSASFYETSLCYLPDYEAMHPKRSAILYDWLHFEESCLWRSHFVTVRAPLTRCHELSLVGKKLSTKLHGIISQKPVKQAKQTKCKGHNVQVLLEMPTVSQLVQKFPTFCGICRFITRFTSLPLLSAKII